MKDIRIDGAGNPRCWNCGSKAFTEKRTLRAKFLVGVSSLLTKKKLKCQRCGEYNDTGNGKPYRGPAGRKYRFEWKAEQAAMAPVAPTAPPTVDVASELERLATLHGDGLLSDEEFRAAKARLLS